MTQNVNRAYAKLRGGPLGPDIRGYAYFYAVEGGLSYLLKSGDCPCISQVMDITL